MSATQERKVTAYPPGKYGEMIRAYAVVQGESESKAVGKAIKSFIDSLPAEKQNQLKKVAKQVFSKNSY